MCGKAQPESQNFIFGKASVAVTLTELARRRSSVVSEAIEDQAELDGEVVVVGT